MPNGVRRSRATKKACPGEPMPKASRLSTFTVPMISPAAPVIRLAPVIHHHAVWEHAQQGARAAAKPARDVDGSQAQPPQHLANARPQPAHCHQPSLSLKPPGRAPSHALSLPEPRTNSLSQMPPPTPLQQLHQQLPKQHRVPSFPLLCPLTPSPPDLMSLSALPPPSPLKLGIAENFLPSTPLPGIGSPSLYAAYAGFKQDQTPIRTAIYTHSPPHSFVQCFPPSCAPPSAPAVSNQFEGRPLPFSPLTIFSPYTNYLLEEFGKQQQQEQQQQQQQQLPPHHYQHQQQRQQQIWHRHTLEPQSTYCRSGISSILDLLSMPQG